MISHDEMVKKMLSDRSAKAKSDARAEDVALAELLRAARKRARLTQAEVALKMGTKTPAVARLETRGNRIHSPSVATLRRYAEAIGCRLEIRLRRKANSSS